MTIVDKNPNWWQFLTKIQSCEAQRRRPGRGGRPRRALLGGRAGEGGGGGAGGRGQAEDRWELGWQCSGGWGGRRLTMAKASTLTWSAEPELIRCSLAQVADDASPDNGKLEPRLDFKLPGNSKIPRRWWQSPRWQAGGERASVRWQLGFERAPCQHWRGLPSARWRLACGSSTMA